MVVEWWELRGGLGDKGSKTTSKRRDSRSE